MATAVPGTTPHITRTAKLDAAAYKFVPLTSAGDGPDKRAGVSWCRVKAIGGDISVQPHYGKGTAATPTAWTTTPVPAATGDVGEALYVSSGDTAEFGVRPGAEEGTDQTVMITGIHIWATGATLISLQGA